MKKYKVKNTNKLVKRAIEDLIGLSIADTRRKVGRGLPAEYLSVYYFYEGYSRELKDSPNQQRHLKEFFEKWKHDFFRGWTDKRNAKLWKANKMWKAFRKHRPVGRPMEVKKPRGRPVDEGII